MCTLTQFGFEPAPDHPPMPVGKHPVVAWALDPKNEVDHLLTAIDAIFAGFPLAEHGRAHQVNDLATMFGRLAATATSISVPNDRSKLVTTITAHVA